jgi:tRNA uridine 5-carbamoylmethylation protein Kti12
MAVEVKSTFVVKDRIEGLEDKVEKVLKIDGLTEMAKDVTSKVLKEALDSSKEEIKETARDVVKEAKEFVLSENKALTVDMDKRLSEASSEFQKAVVEHIGKVEERLAKTERLLKIALTLTLASTAWSTLAGFLN